jgi:hypothetical protein
VRNRSHFVVVSCFGRQKTERFVNTRRKTEGQVASAGLGCRRFFFSNLIVFGQINARDLPDELKISDYIIILLLLKKY